MSDQRSRPSAGLRDLRSDDPTRVGPYELEAKIGEGGMGAVYLGRAPGGQLVAVKVVRPELAEDRAFLSRFNDEMANAERVASFCTAQVLDHGEDLGMAYMVTEYIDGPSLLQHIQENGPLTPGMLHGVSVGVAAALVAIHSAGLVHRDLKPSNVLLSISGPRVIDFGIARALDAATSHTKTGQVVGTPGYIAPEQILTQQISPAVDIFAWGCLVAYAANGRNPFGTGSFQIMVGRALHADPELGALTDPLASLVRTALSKEPEHRPSARGLLLSLVGGAGGESEITTHLGEAFAAPDETPASPPPVNLQTPPPAPWALSPDREQSQPQSAPPAAPPTPNWSPPPDREQSQPPAAAQSSPQASSPPSPAWASPLEREQSQPPAAAQSSPQASSPPPPAWAPPTEREQSQPPAAAEQNSPQPPPPAPWASPPERGGAAQNSPSASPQPAPPQAPERGQGAAPGWQIPAPPASQRPAEPQPKAGDAAAAHEAEAGANGAVAPADPRGWPLPEHTDPAGETITDPSLRRPSALPPPGPTPDPQAVHAVEAPTHPPAARPVSRQPSTRHERPRRNGLVVAGAAALTLVAATGAGAAVWFLQSDDKKAAPTGNSSAGPAPFPTDPMFVRIDSKPGWPSKCYGDIGRFTPASKKAETLVSGSTCDMLPEHSPDRGKVAFTRQAGDKQSAWVMDANGGNLEEVDADLAGGRLTWSPDGTKLAGMRKDGGGARQIYIIPLDGSTPQKVTSDGSVKDDPMWSPTDPNKLVFWSSRDGEQTIYTLDVRNPGKWTRISQPGVKTNDPEWSPDGKQIAYTRGTYPKGHIWVMDADGRNDHQLTKGSEHEMDPNWSRDGKWLAYVRGTFAKPVIRAVRLDGTGDRAVTDDTKIAHPNW
ncbi:protein kinase [Spirillospora sp. NPDC048911]|uniref:protein kinase domain-containing protein n=1 Tax=Spirillospora sp. NPDC048911 TaxID=3364527 RepID=UPI0037140DDB